MHRRIFSIALIGFLSIVIINWSCTKLDTTNLGSDLIPVVDNINTFADTFLIDAVQKDYIDTTAVDLTDNHALGNITSDPLFGATTANIYMQLKPTFFPYGFGNKDSIVGLDSVILCIAYKGSWGDTNAIQTLQATEIVDTLFKDSTTKIWNVSDVPPVTGAAISLPTNVDVRRLPDLMRYAHVKDSVSNQIRMRLQNPYASDLFYSDSTNVGAGNHAFYSDSAFKRLYNGIAVKAIGTGNALMYVNIADTNTKIEFHYRIKNAGKIDTTYKSFKLNTAGSTSRLSRSRTANNIVRTRSGASTIPSPTEVYLQTQPGTYASLKIPGLTGYSNRIIHRAEIIIEQVPDNILYDSIFPAPAYMYLDLKDSGSTVKYKPVYYDLNPSESYDPDLKVNYFYPTSGPDFGYFGGYSRKKYTPAGSIVYYNINVSRYVQQLVKNQGINYEMRLFPAFQLHYSQYSTYRAYNNNIALGRVKVGTGANPTYPMRMRIIYSKIK